MAGHQRQLSVSSCLADLIYNPFLLSWHLCSLGSQSGTKEEEEEEEGGAGLCWLAPFTKPVTVQLTSNRDENIPINLSDSHFSV